MFHAGDQIENPVTGERLVFHETASETAASASSSRRSCSPAASSRRRTSTRSRPSASRCSRERSGCGAARRRSSFAPATTVTVEPRHGAQVLERGRRRGALRLHRHAGAPVRAADRDDVLARGRRQDEQEGHAEPAPARRDREPPLRRRPAAAHPAAGCRSSGSSLGAPVGKAARLRPDVRPDPGRARTRGGVTGGTLYSHHRERRALRIVALDEAGRGHGEDQRDAPGGRAGRRPPGGIAGVALSGMAVRRRRAPCGPRSSACSRPARARGLRPEQVGALLERRSGMTGGERLRDDLVAGRVDHVLAAIAAPDRGYTARRFGPLAQLVEQGTLNPKVAGSIPARPTPKSDAMQSGWNPWESIFRLLTRPDPTEKARDPHGAVAGRFRRRRARRHSASLCRR